MNPSGSRAMRVMMTSLNMCSLKSGGCKKKKRNDQGSVGIQRGRSESLII